MTPRNKTRPVAGGLVTPEHYSCSTPREQSPASRVRGNSSRSLGGGGGEGGRYVTSGQFTSGPRWRLPRRRAAGARGPTRRAASVCRSVIGAVMTAIASCCHAAGPSLSAVSRTLRLPSPPASAWEMLSAHHSVIISTYRQCAVAFAALHTHHAFAVRGRELEFTGGCRWRSTHFTLSDLLEYVGDIELSALL